MNSSSSVMVPSTIGLVVGGAGRVGAHPGDQRALVVGVGEDGDEVLGDRLATALGDELGAQGRVLAEGGRGGDEGGVVGLGVALAVHHGVGPLVELATLLGVEAHELGDDDQRQVDGEVLDEVDLAPIGDVVDELGGELAHVVGELAHPGGGEAPVDETAHPRVLGVVHGDDRQRHVEHGAHALRPRSRARCGARRAPRPRASPPPRGRCARPSAPGRSCATSGRRPTGRRRSAGRGCRSREPSASS